ncbi:uracil-DNA glycosylase family protein [Campylobacter sp. RM16704]|uniref:uracil-DNA glycosylase family protein n=1 Tax=Campylobacter sp. RM16704 TaxID=1500960 RepID=UPI00057DD1F9|nr:uracil-DNA glycosylase family protein [Campylobacter sp. RM16704]AJC86063.1 uracil-DNA glycosylase family protein [Campylobacter sp. RM16704]
MDKRNLHYLRAFGFEYIEEQMQFKKHDLNFEELKDKVKNCKLCHFSKLRKNILMEKEVKNAKIIIFQSFVDKDENESGKLFASKAKQELLQICKELLNLSENEIYFSYMIKCFSNFKIDEYAVNSCLPYFYSELEFIKAKLVLCLGKEAFAGLGFENFQKYKGQWLHFNNILLLPSYDLNFLNKNPSFYTEFIEDIKKIKGYL